MKAFIYGLAVIVLIPFSASGRIGDTFDQLVQRFGPDTLGLGPQPVQNLFQFKDWQIYVNLLSDRSACERYAILGSSSDPSSKRPTSQEDIDSILEINGGGKKWTKLSETDLASEALSQGISGSRRLENAWILDDHSLICIQVNERPMGRWFMIMSKEWRDRQVDGLKKMAELGAQRNADAERTAPVAGTYSCVNMGRGHDSDYIGSTGDIMEFRTNGVVVVSSVVGKYEQKAARLTLTIQMMGATREFVGQIRGDEIRFDYDGSLWRKRQ